MTDNEIIKALECHKSKSLNDCENCPLYTKKIAFQSYHIELFDSVLDLINRQKAEIEKLRKDGTDIDNFARAICRERTLKGKAIAGYEDLQSYIRKREAEAIKGFAERLKQDLSFGKYIQPDQIDNLVKEITGGEDNA